MIALALRGMAARKLRSGLSAIAILLGVAMIAGTYILTDQIRNAFEDITARSVEGIDVVVTPAEAFSTQFTEPQTLDESLVDRVNGVDGVAAAEGSVVALGQLVVDGEIVETGGAPGLVFGSASDQFDTTDLVSGRKPSADNEATILEQTADRQDVEVGDTVGIATSHGVEDVEIVGVFSYGEGGSSLGGATAVIVPTAQVQQWFDLQGQVSSISAIGESGVAPAALAARVKDALPETTKVQTGEENATEEADEINDSIGSFLTPALLALAGAAVLVGGFIIFNTFSITVAQRTREFGLLRALGAGRRQILTTVIAEAFVVALLATIAGIAVGMAIAAALGALFDAIGFGIPRTGLTLETRTIVISFVVGIGVTLVAALAPALRATRVPPVIAMSNLTVEPSRRTRIRRSIVAGLVLIAGLILGVQGLFGSGPAEARLAGIAGGAILLFIGVALTARYLVRPLAAVIGLPIEWLAKVTGRLARENAIRNPSRTAITSAALMVGVGLVVFVAVLAAGLVSSFSRQIDNLVRADVIVYDRNFGPLPTGAEGAIDDVPGVKTVVPGIFDQLEVNGASSNSAYDLAIGVDPAKLPDVYTFEWIDGDDSLINQLGPGRALVEEQFAKAHDVGVGDSYDVVTPSGGTATFEAIGVYRDPTILSGSVVDMPTLQEISNASHPVTILVAVDDAADANAVQGEIAQAMTDFPGAKVENKAEYKDTIEGQLNQIVYLLYALLAMSLVISLFGIANSLFLSIHERTRELGLLRAVGATPRQLKRMIRYESVITAVIGGILGTAVGILFGWLTTESLSEFGLSTSIPFGQLVVYLVIAVIVGVLGAIAPARRAARVDVLDAMRTE